MTTLTPFNAYRLYTAYKLHFTTSYDIIKYQGKIKAVTPASFDIRKDRFFFHKLAKKFDGEETYGNFLIANLIYNPKIWSGELVTEEAYSVYKEYQKRMESLSYTFKEELGNILDLEDDVRPDDFKELFIVIKNDHPWMLKQYLAKKVSLETLLILNKCLGFMAYWDKVLGNDVFWPDISKLCKKYDVFLDIDIHYYRKIFKELIQ